MSFRKTPRMSRSLFEPIESRQMMAADLSITAMNLSEQVLNQAQLFNATVTVRNNGDKAVPAGTAMRLTLTVDETLRNWEPAERSLGLKKLPSDLKPKKTYTFEVKMRASAQPTGTFRLGAEIDYNNAVAETNEKNNVVISEPLITYAKYLESQTIEGTDKKDVISFKSSGDNAIVNVNGETFVAHLNNWPVLIVNTGKGNDRVQTTADFPVRLQLNGGSGHDTLIGGAKNDEINGGTGDDRLYGNDGDDIVNGSGGHDRLYGDGGNDQLNAGSGNDRLYGGPGADTLSGSGGKDIGQKDDSDVVSSCEQVIS